MLRQITHCDPPDGRPRWVDGSNVGYIASCAALGALLLVAANTKPVVAKQLLWVIAWAVSLPVTRKGARRDGRRPLPWVFAVAIVGPFAWVAMAASRPTEVG